MQEGWFRWMDTTVLKKFKILSIDGGGVRGIIPAKILQSIEEQHGKPISDIFDMIIGTSTGALISLCLACPSPSYKASDIVDIYKNESKNIFKKSILRDIFTGNGLWAPKYERTYLDNMLKRTFSTNKNGISHTFLSHSKCKVLIPTYCLIKGEPIVHSSEEAKRNTFEDFRMWEIAAAATSAPVYFKPFCMKYFKGLNLNHYEYSFEVDGGIWINNPESLAISEYLKLIKSKNYESVSVLSIGTGHQKYSITDSILNSDGNMGAIGWLRNGLIDMMITADMDESAIIGKAIFDKYHRVQFNLSRFYELDNSSENAIQGLLGIAHDIISDTEEMGKIMEIVNA
jgi:patatin-like phospholipase/acyl hydrolase